MQLEYREFETIRHIDLLKFAGASLVIILKSTQQNNRNSAIEKNEIAGAGCFGPLGHFAPLLHSIQALYTGTVQQRSSWSGCSGPMPKVPRVQDFAP